MQPERQKVFRFCDHVVVPKACRLCKSRFKDSGGIRVGKTHGTGPREHEIIDIYVCEQCSKEHGGVFNDLFCARCEFGKVNQKLVALGTLGLMRSTAIDKLFQFRDSMQAEARAIRREQDGFAHPWADSDSDEEQEE